MQPKEITRKGEILSTGSFYVEQEKGKQKTETKFLWALPGAT